MLRLLVVFLPQNRTCQPGEKERSHTGGFELLQIGRRRGDFFRAVRFTLFASLMIHVASNRALLGPDPKTAFDSGTVVAERVHPRAQQLWTDGKGGSAERGSLTSCARLRSVDKPKHHQFNRNNPVPAGKRNP